MGFLVSWLDDTTALFTRMGEARGGDPLRAMQGGVHHMGRPAKETGSC